MNTLSVALVALAAMTASAPLPSEAVSVQKEVRATRVAVKKVPTRLSRGADACRAEVIASLEDVRGDLDAFIDARALERVRTELKWMARFSSHVCPASVTSALTKAHVAAERAMVAFDVEADRISAEQERIRAREEAEATAAAEAKAKAEAEEEKRKQLAQVQAARDDYKKAHARQRELAECWQADDPGCGVHRDGQRAMNKTEFEAFVTKVTDAWASERLGLIVAEKARSYFTTRQLGRLVEELSGTDHLKVVKILSKRIVDPQNFAAVEGSFWRTDWAKVVTILASERPKP